MNDIERKIEDCTDEINKIQEWIGQHPMDSNVRFLVAYSVLKSSGTIEVVFKSMLYKFLAEGCKNETITFLEKSIIDLSCNPSTGNMERLLEQFDPTRKKQFGDALKGTPEKNDLNSLVSLRNDIAHGRNINQSIKNIKNYYESGLKVVHKLKEVLWPDSANNTSITVYELNP